MRPIPATDAEAQEYLTLLRTLPAEHLGPHRRFRNPALDAAPLNNLAPRVVAAVEQIDEKTFIAPSPWHAAAWLSDIAALAGQVADVDRDSGLRCPFPPQHGAPVFRGQRNPDWKLIPTLYRGPGFVINQLALHAMIDMLTKFFSLFEDDTRMNGPYVHMAAAQHYGMSTSLLDFTADPRIAVWFACNAAQVDRDQQVVVYGIPFNDLAESGGVVVFPPPWVKRLYAQRGFFIDCASLSTSFDLRELCFKVLFPPHAEYGPSLLSAGDEALLPPDSWYAETLDWLRDAVRNADYSFWAHPLEEQLKRRIGLPPFFADAMLPHAMQHALDGFVDMCEWLALKSVRGTLTYDCTTIISLWRHNEPLFRNFRVIWRYLNSVIPEIDERGGQHDRLMAAFQAITLCVEEISETEPNVERQ